MKVVAAATALVFVLMLKQSDGVTVDFERECKKDHISHGFRRDSWQRQAIHYCFPSKFVDKNCRTLAADNVGINCSSFGKNYFLQGGLPNRRAKCCEKKGFTLANCTIQRQVFSFAKGFNIMYFQRVLQNLIPISATSDPSMFEIQLCDMDTNAYVKVQGTNNSIPLPPPPPPPSGLSDTPVV